LRRSEIFTNTVGRSLLLVLATFRNNAEAEMRAASERNRGARHAEFDSPGELARLCGHGLERFERAVHRGTSGLEEALAGVGECDAARSARKERESHTLFELAHGLT